MLHINSVQTVLYVRHLCRIEPEWYPLLNFANIVNFKDHARLYTVAPEFQIALKNIYPTDGNVQIQANIPDEIKPPFDNLNHLMEHLKSLGIRVYVKRLTTRDIMQFGHEVVRVLSPDLMPLHGHHQMPTLQCSRLWNLENIFPFPIKSPNSQDDVYPWPHPFA